MSFERTKSVPANQGFFSNGVPQSLNAPGTYHIGVGSFTLTNISDDHKHFVVWVWGACGFQSLAATYIGTRALQVRLNGGAWTPVAVDGIDQLAATELVKEHSKIFSGAALGVNGLAPGATLTVETRVEIVITAGGSGSSLGSGFSGGCAWTT